MTIAKSTYRFPPILAAALLLAAAGPLLAQYAPPLPSASKTRSLSASADLLIVDCGGRYIKATRSSSGILETGTLSVLSGDNAPGTRVDGCIIDDVRALLPQSILLTVAARDRFLDAAGKRRYSLLASDLATLKERSRYDIAIPQSEAPKLLVSSTGNTAYIIRSSNQLGNPVPGVERIDIATMRGGSIGAISERTATQLVTPEGVVADDAGRFQIDSKPIEKMISASVSATELRAVISYWNSNPSRDKAAITSDQSNFKIARAARVGNIAIYIAGWDRQTARQPNGSIIAYDIVGKSVISDFRTSSSLAPFDGTTGTPNVHLTPKGEVIIIETYDWSKTPTEKGGSRAKSGELLAYDLRTGTFLGKTQVSSESNQHSRVLGFSRDGNSLLYATRDKFFTISISSMTVSSTVDLPVGFIPVVAISTQ